MTRLTLPQRRHAEAFEFEHDGIRYRASISRAAPLEGPPVEIFVEGGKPGSNVQALARDCAVLASLALQFGCPVETIQKALTRVDDATPAGPMGRVMDVLVSGGV